MILEWGMTILLIMALMRLLQAVGLAEAAKSLEKSARDSLLH
jgi:hypothetical protein